MHTLNRAYCRFHLNIRFKFIRMHECYSRYCEKRVNYKRASITDIQILIAVIIGKSIKIMFGTLKINNLLRSVSSRIGILLFEFNRTTELLIIINQ